jgi:phosphoenolpyruvate synthase/pyruvate phosphate dikinase
MSPWIRWFDDLGIDDVSVVGGKNASLGEMRRALTPLGIRTPDGFATTADAYRAFLRAAGLEGVISASLARVDINDIDALQAAGARVRSAILAAPLPDALTQAVTEAYQWLEAQYGANCDVAGRKIGICGQAPSDYAEFARFLVTERIDSLSLNPDSLLKTMVAIVDLEDTLAAAKAAVTRTELAIHEG